MSQMQTLGTHKTTVSTDGEGITRITYHNTIVVKYDNLNITLDSGGYETTSTKARMNQASNQFSLGYQVFQKDFTWYIKTNTQTIKFFDGIMLNRGTM